MILLDKLYDMSKKLIKSHSFAICRFDRHIQKMVKV